jgi:FlaA1/EpsC-like NDP-sugar epimerase
MQFDQLFELSSRKKLSIAVLWDFVALLVASIFAFWIRLGIASWNFSNVDAVVIILNVVFALTLLSMFGHYRQMIRFIGLIAIQKALLVLAFSALSLLAARVAFDVMIPVSVPFIYWSVASILVITPRFLMQASAQSQNYKMREKCLIFGAAEAGRSLVQTLKMGNQLQPIAFIDDKKQYHNKQILGLPVGRRADIPYYVERFGVSKMLLAVHNTSADRRKELIVELEPYAIELLSIPNIQDLLSGKSKIDELREIRIEELLGREPVPPITRLLDINIRSKNVMVTGAGGSIGSELCRQICAY